MVNLDGFKEKFIVIKKEYLDTENGQRLADALCEHVEHQRFLKTGKAEPAKYLVINVDEPYADEVIEILKRNGHWG